MNYPILIIPEQIEYYFKNEISKEEILEYLGLAFPTLDLRIYYRSTQSFYGTNVENDKKIAELKTRFPNAVLIEKSFLSTKYEICYTIDEKRFINSEYTFGKPSIGGINIIHPPLKYETHTEKGKEYGCLVGSIIMALVILAFVSSFSFNAFLFLSFVFAAFFIFFSKNLYQETSEQIETPKPDREYKEEVDKFINYLEEKKSILRREYEEKINEINTIIEINKVEASREIYRQKIKPKVGFRKVNSNSNRGKSEIYFLEKLYNEFGKQILVDIYPDVGKNPFQPDFIYTCEQTGFCIDIEIDEPYSVDNGKPIHHDRSDDERRDLFFNDSNIIVLRFTEKQIIQHTKECCNLILNLISAVRYDSFYQFEHNVPLEKKWTYEEALIHSKNNYRNSYLPTNMKTNIILKKDIKKDISSKYDYDEFDDLPF